MLVSAERPLDILDAHMPPLGCYEGSSKGRHTFGNIVESELYLCVRRVLKPHLKIIVAAKILEDDSPTSRRSITEFNPEFHTYGVIATYRNYRAFHLYLSGLVPQHHI